MSREIIDREHVGRLMHESWSNTKRAQGFHGPSDKCPLNPTGKLVRYRTNPAPNSCVCTKQHLDLIPWDDLPEKQKDINRHAFDDVLPYFERLLADEREALHDEIGRIGAQAARVLAGNSAKNGEAKQFATFVLEKARAIEGKG